MPFMFKLSRRWARLRTVVVAGTLVVAACEVRRALTPIDDVDRVELAPPAVTVQPNQTVDFAAVAFTPASDTAEVIITWSATGGSITDQGRQGGRHLGQYRNGSCGAFKVAATSQPGHKSDTADVTVACPVAVATVTVSPAQASVDTGQTVQLTATPRDASGNALTGRVIGWTSDNPAAATVSGSGLVRGVAAGSATITATSEGKSGASAITVTTPPPPGGGVVFVGAGDIAGCSSSGDEATAQLLDTIAGTVFTLGDNAYPDGTSADFANCYEPSWGRHKTRTRPSPGNHDYHTSSAAPYYAYFGATAGPAGRGYYSYDLGEWHIISLNSNVSMSAGSAQEQWLRADLAASPNLCTLAYWHHPRFSSSTNHGSSTAPQPLWQALYEAGADVVLSGHDHTYERFAPQTPSGAADATRGIREFVVGTGGISHYSIGTPVANSEVQNGDTYGVLKLTLYADRYDWVFVPVAGRTFTDSGTGTCH